jgi:3-oxoacyl-[acyl-carrier protein] reductase
MKFALVTGGSRGIGRAVCLKMADMGYNILINYKSNETEANQTLLLVKEKGVNAEIIQFDVSDKEPGTICVGKMDGSKPGKSDRGPGK